MKKLFTFIFTGIFVCSLMTGCGSKTDSTLSTTLSIETETMTYPEDENMRIAYSINEDGTYSYDGKTYQYKIELTGRERTAVCDSKYIVLTDNKDITFEQISDYMLMPDENHMLEHTIIIGMVTLDE